MSEKNRQLDLALIEADQKLELAKKFRQEAYVAAFYPGRKVIVRRDVYKFEAEVHQVVDDEHTRIKLDDGEIRYYSNVNISPVD